MKFLTESLKKTIKTNFKDLFRFINFIFALLFCTQLNADIIRLKDGKIYEGTYISETNESFVFETDNGVMTIPKKNILKMEMGYTGSSFCYVLEDSQEICEGILHYVDGEKIIIGKGKGSVIKEEFSLSSLKSYSIKKIRKKDKLTSVLQQGVRLEIVTEKEKKLGKIVSTDPISQKLVLQTGEDEIIFKEEEIKEINWMKSRRGMGYYSLQTLKFTIPGLLEYPVNKWEGIGMMGLFLGLGIAIPATYNSAASAAAGSETYVPINGNLYIVNGLVDTGFASKRNAYMAALGGMGALYLIHSFEVWRYAKQGKYAEEFDTLSLSIQNPTFLSPPILQNSLFLANPMTNTNIELKFSHSF
jgi:RNase P/RNase MRP subunit p29